jgi:broad specificity phosphatase PhoE
MDKEIVFFRHFKKLYNNKYQHDKDLLNINIDKNIHRMHDSPIMKSLIYKKYEFKREDYDIVYVSPYLRTRETYDYLFGDKNYFIDNRIREYLGHSCHKGKALDVCKETKEYVKDNPGEEAEIDFEERCFSFFDELMSNNHQKIFVITHGFVITKFFKYIQQKDCKINEGDYMRYTDKKE